jgi:signal transduction histidine kinase
MIALNITASPPENPMKILHLEDSVLDHKLVCRALSRNNHNVVISRVDQLDEFVAAVETSTFDVILADYRLSGFNALDAWQAIKKTRESQPFILVSGAIGEAAAVAAIQEGISDYVHKDELSTLGRVIERVLSLSASKRAKEAADIELAHSQKQLSEFADHLQTTIEIERAAIAREIHDDIGGALAAAKLDLAWISRNGTDAATLAHAKAATEMLIHAIGASQRIMLNLRPAILDQGLIAAIQWLCSSFEKRTAVPVGVATTQDTMDLPKNVQIAAYRTVQEALTNCGKYSNCKKIQIDVSDDDSVLTVEIKDDGIGIEKSDLLKEKSFGIRGLRERARTVGGWLDISSKPGYGTSVILTVPLTPDGGVEISEGIF